jgi:hypothetical protein
MEKALTRQKKDQVSTMHGFFCCVDVSIPYMAVLITNINHLLIDLIRNLAIISDIIAKYNHKEME